MNILITSVGRRGYLVEYFKMAVGENGEVHVANSSDISPAFLYADKSVVTPLIYDSNYINFLKQYSKENKIDIIISLFDIDLPILSKNKSEFEEIGVKVIVSNEECVDICNDKWKTYEFLKRNNINTPLTYLGYKEAINALESGEIEYPVIIKPRWGMGSISVFEAENMEELNVLYKKIERNILNTYLKYEAKNNMENAILIQEKINGEEYGVDVINNLNGKYVNCIIKEKYAMRSGETDCAKIVDSKEIKKVAIQLSNKLEHIANLDVDMFLVKDKVYVLEMNARFGGGYPFSHIAGANLPLSIIKWANNETVELEELTAETGIIAHKDITIVKIRE